MVKWKKRDCKKFRRLCKGEEKDEENGNEIRRCCAGVASRFGFRYDGL